MLLGFWCVCSLAAFAAPLAGGDEIATRGGENATRGGEEAMNDDNIENRSGEIENRSGEHAGTAPETFFRRLATGVTYAAEASASVSGGNSDFAPLWLSAGRHGLSSTAHESGYLRGGIFRSTSVDGGRNWRWGYGVDVAVGQHFTSTLVINQLYADVEWKALRLSIGAKERNSELKNAALSSGGLTFSGNARAVPGVRLELPDFWAIPGTRHWLAIKGHIAYGAFTDENWQEDFAAPTAIRASGVRYHSKAGFLRVGNEEKFPLTFTGGLEMYAQFGGEAWNVTRRIDDTSSFDGTHVKLPGGVSSYWHAFIPGGSDASDGDFANSEGNQLGSWHFQLEYAGKDWRLKGYAEHFFEDHSQMFVQYGWKDMLWGAELTLPKNRVLGTVLYEYLHTTDQSGGVYHDATDALPVQISGTDNYYNHNIYAGWQHWGQGIGNPLLISPIYDREGNITFSHNRIRAHHIGICGTPTAALSYRALFSHIKSLGTYANPLRSPQFGNYLLLEATYAPTVRHGFFQGFSLTGSFATNGGSLLGGGAGGMLTLRKTGLL